MLIRALTAEDADAYVALRVESLLLDPFSFGASPGDDVASSVEFFMQRLPDTYRRIFGAFNPGLVGAVGINRNATIKGKHKAHIWGMYVRAESRRMGVGVQLMQAAVDFAAAMSGVRYVHLCVSDRSGGAQALYERMGFRVWGTEPAAMVIDGVDVPEEHMVLTLPRPASGVRLPS